MDRLATNPADSAAQRSAMRLSLVVGLAMLGGKGTAYMLTGSAAVLSDAAESVVHVVAVSFATFSLWLALQPPDRNHLYGHEKIAFFSAGFEGAMIIVAALFIIYEAIVKWIGGLQLQNPDLGVRVTAAAAAGNGLLGWYLIRTGRRQRSLVLVANGQHVLTDSITSLGVIVALVLVWLTGWKPVDPLLAIAIALHILWSGVDLMRQSFRGLMDHGDPETDRVLREALDEWVASVGGQYHGLRHRNSGSVTFVEVHLLFPGQQPLDAAHAAATALEQHIEAELHPARVMVTTHLEPLEAHAEHHPRGGIEHEMIGG